MSLLRWAGMLLIAGLAAAATAALGIITGLAAAGVYSGVKATVGR